MKVLQINSVVNSGSTGRIAEDIGKVVMANGHESYIAYGRGSRPSKSELIKIGKSKDVYLHVLKSFLLDRHGFGSRAATKQFINDIIKIDPTIIHLHNIHGYYLHVEELFTALSALNRPVVWTFHDCWPFTGHCTYFEYEGCYRWKHECGQCPKRNYYPKSLFIDNSANNFIDKRRLFTSIKNLRIVTPSAWLSAYVKESFLKDFEVEVIHNGVDLIRFINATAISSKYPSFNSPYILGVANVWSKRKGLDDLIKLNNLLMPSYTMVIVGVSNEQKRSLPEGIIAIDRTESLDELASLYANASVYINPTYQDNFPTTNIEALACGTPVITYNTGGSPEAVDEYTGRVIEKGDIAGLAKAVEELASIDRDTLRMLCRARAEKYFNKDVQFDAYLKLYEKMISDGK